MPLDEKHTGKNRATLVAQRKVAVDNRRAKVASGKVRGLSLRQIQAEMDAAGDVNPANGKTWSLGILGKDSIVLTERYKAEALRDTVTWIQGELQKLDEVERVAWEAWRRGSPRHRENRSPGRCRCWIAGSQPCVRSASCRADASRRHQRR